MKAFYHSADLDGHCSGAIIKMTFPKCEMIGINYGDEFPWESLTKGEDVYMVDFSLQPFEQMIRLFLATGVNLVWIDHHKSSIEEYQKRPKIGQILGIQRSGIGACQLVWEYLKPRYWEHTVVEVPTFIKLLAEYDVWNHSDPRTLSFQYGMRQFKDTSPGNIGLWRSLFDIEEVQRIAENGAILLDYQQTENEKYIKACGFDTELDGLRCIAVNKLLTNSMLFTSVWDPQKYDAMLTFGFRKGKWTVSLYSDKPDIDVSEICKDRGGGGHKGASGFQCEQLPFPLKQ